MGRIACTARCNSTNITKTRPTFCRALSLTLLAMPPTKTRLGISMPNFGTEDINAELTASRLDGHGDWLPDAAAVAWQTAPQPFIY